MKKISDFKNEDAIELLADIVEPCSTIVNDTELRKDFAKDKMKAVSKGLKKYKKEIIEILARLEDVPVKEFTCTPVTLVSKVLDVLNDKELNDFLSSLAQTEE